MNHLTDLKTSNQSGITSDRFSWLWLFIGAALLPFIGFQTVMPLAAWLAPIFIIRFARTQRSVIALPVIALVSAAASAIAARGFFDSLLLNLISPVMGAVVGLLTYGMDRLLAPRLSGLPRTLVFPTAVIIVDFLMSFGPNGTMGMSAYSQYDNLPLIQIVSVTGIWGLSFLMAWCGPVVNELWEHGFESHSARRIGGLFLGVLLAVLAFGNLRLAFTLPASQTVRVAGLAADRNLSHGLNIPSISKIAAGTDELRASVRTETAPQLDDLFTRTRQEAQAGAKIVSWSEAAALVLKEDEPAVLERARAIAQEENIYLQMALVVYLRTDHYPFAENRAIMIDPSGSVVWDYAKTNHPLGDKAIFAPGPGVLPMVNSPFGRLSTVICFDADFPSLIRQAGGADLLLVPANDWEPVAEFHSRMAIFRAIENGVSMVRPTGNGISLAVDDLGRLRAYNADYFVTGKHTLVTTVPIQGRPTLYSRIGDSFAYLCVAMLIVLLGLAVLQRRPVTATKGDVQGAEQVMLNHERGI
jgi:apolipoprotein N-acyltransferase